MIKGILLEIISDCLINSNNDDFPLAEFDLKINQIEKYFLDDNIGYAKKLPLYGVLLEENIKITDEISIEILSDADIIELIENGLITDIFPRLSHRRISHYPRVALTFNSFEKKIFIENDWATPTLLTVPEEFAKKQEQRKLNESVAISLLSAILGNGVTPACSIEKTINLINNFLIPIRKPVSNYTLIQSPETLTRDKGLKLINFWKNIAKYDCLKIATNRYAAATTKPVSDDKLIDLMICAEALFLQDGNAELTYKLAHRAALFLGEDSASKKKIFKFFKNAYSIRSSVVHGIKSFEHGEKPKIDLEELECYLRAALMKFLDNHASSRSTSKELINWDSLVFPED